jgi:hypothetical protein
MFQIDGIFGTQLFCSKSCMCAVVKDDAVLQELLQQKHLYERRQLSELLQNEVTSTATQREKKRPRAPKHNSAGRKGSSTVP